MYRYLENDHTCYAGNLVQTQSPTGLTELKWDCSNGCSILLVLSTKGEDVSSRMDEICQKLNSIGDNSLLNDFYEFETGTFVKVINTIDNLGKSAEVTGRGRYMVFACKEDNGDFDIYPPAEGGMLSRYYHDVSLKIGLHIQEEMKTVTEGSFFKKKELSVSSGYYSVRFPAQFNVSQYKDGELFYAIKGVEIPITGSMIRQEMIYIRSEGKPELRSKNNAIEVVEL